MPVPDLESIMMPMLKFLGDKKDHSMKEVEESLAIFFKLNEDEKRQLKPSGGESIFHNRLHWAKFYLKKAVLVEGKPRSGFKITPRGISVLKEGPDKIDTEYLTQFREFKDFIR